MHGYRSLFGVIIIGIAFYGCAGLPSDAAPDPVLQEMPFAELVSQAAQHRGATVVVGGYVLAVENLAGQTLVTALQAPLDGGRKPKSKDLSQGRLILVYHGFLDPEIYTKNRRITVDGTILGSSAEAGEASAPFPYLRVQVYEMRLWPKETFYPAWPYDYWYDPWWRPYPWYGYRHPYHWR